MRSVLRALSDRAACRGSDVAIIDPDGRTWTHQELLDVAGAGCVRVEAAADRTATVLVRGSSGGAFWASVLAVTAAGRDVALLASDTPEGVLKRVAHDIGTLIEFNPEWLAGPARGSLPLGESVGGVVLHSSGTTGRSRLVRRTPEAVDLVARGLIDADLYRPTDRVASFLPMHHAYGFEHALLAPMLSGAMVRCWASFDVDQVRDGLADGVSVMPTVGAAVDALLSADVKPVTLRHAIVAGSSLGASIRARWVAATKCPLIDLYGATEVGSIWLDRGTGGAPMPGVELRLVDPRISDRLVPAEVGHHGEIAVRTLQMAERVVGDGHAPLHQDGWFRTGDLGQQDSRGQWRIVGRSKLLFDVGGLKVNPVEVELALCEHPAIAMALVGPVESGGVTRVGARLEVRPGRDRPSLVELREFLRQHIPAHAIPRDIGFEVRLPRTASGKILRAAPSVSPAGHVAIAPVSSRPAELSRRSEREAWTRQLFSGTARDYDSASTVASFGTGSWYRRKLLKGFGLKQGMSVLDVGSGTGVCAEIAQSIVTHTGRVVALDPSPEMLAIARRRGITETVVGFAEAIPFSAGTFDFVTMSFMLRHVDDLRAAFAEARRVLRPGGRILVFELSPPNHAALRWAFRHLMCSVVPFACAVTSRRAATFKMMRYWGQTMDVAVPKSTILEALASEGFLATRCYTELGVFHCYRGVVPLPSGTGSAPIGSAIGTESTISPVAMVVSPAEAVTSNRYSEPSS